MVQTEYQLLRACQNPLLMFTFRREMGPGVGNTRETAGIFAAATSGSTSINPVAGDG